MTAQDEYVESSLRALQSMQIIGLPADQRTAWRDKVDAIRDQYRQARDAERNESLDAASRKAFKERADAVSKAAPAMTKGVAAAIASLQAGDAIGGSADVMDICTSIASLVGGMSSAAGPAGALVGAFFSVASTILRAFGGKQESDGAKTRKMIADLQTQAKIERLSAGYSSISAYAATLTSQANSVAAMLAMPLNTADQAEDFESELSVSGIILAAVDPHGSREMFANWAAVTWLEDPEHRDDVLWPVVLGVCCQAYAAMTASKTAFSALVKSDTMQARRRELEPGGTSTLPDETRKTLVKKIKKIYAYVEAREREYKTCNTLMHGKLADLAGLARSWGLFAHIGDSHKLYFTSGPTRTARGEWTTINDRDAFHRFALFAGSGPARGTAVTSADLMPRYHCVSLKSDQGEDYRGSWRRDDKGMNHWVDHMWVSTRSRDGSDVHKILDEFEPAPTDIWVAQETDAGLHVFGGTAAVAGAAGSVTAWHLSGRDGYTAAHMVRDNWWPQLPRAVRDVRAVYKPVVAAGDPDAAHIAPGWDGGVIYASARGSSVIWVNTSNTAYDMPCPDKGGPCEGIAVDQSYLWFFQRDAIAVISHASVLAHVRSGGKTPPRWCRWNPKDTPAEMREGLISISPCADGTILVATEVAGKRRILTAPYRVDIVGASLKVGAATVIPGEALQVQKLPMPGWHLYDNLLRLLA